eukprot:3599903-Ditylum_brightwellii.AAC.1
MAANNKKSICFYWKISFSISKDNPIQHSSYWHSHSPHLEDVKEQDKEFKLHLRHNTDIISSHSVPEENYDAVVVGDEIFKSKSSCSSVEVEIVKDQQKSMLIEDDHKEEGD